MNPAALLNSQAVLKVPGPYDMQNARNNAQLGQLKVQGATRDEQDELAIRQALMSSGGRLDDGTIAKIAMVKPAAAQAIIKGQYDQTKAKHDADEAALKATSQRIQIAQTQSTEMAKRIRDVQTDGDLQLMIEGLTDDLAPAPVRAKLLGMRVGTPEWDSLKKATMAQALSQEQAAKIEHDKIAAAYAKNAEDRAAAKEARDVQLAKFNLKTAESQATDTIRDDKGLNPKDKAALLKPKPLPGSAQEFEYLNSLPPDQRAAYVKYQNEDANRHRPVTNISVAGATGSAAEPGEMAKAVANYEMDISRALSRGNMGDKESFMKQVKAVNPDYDAKEFGARNATALDYSTKGKAGQALTAADTALAHLNTVENLSKAMKNGDVQQLNRLFNFVGDQLGQAPPNNFRTAVQMVAPEIMKAVIGQGTALADRKDMEEGFSGNASDAKIMGAVQTAARLLADRVKKSKHAYKEQMGHELKREFSPESQELLKRFESGAGGGGQAGKPKSGDTRSYQGHDYKFDGKEWKRQ